MPLQAINVVFDGPPGPESGRFVEVELDDGRSVRVGEWVRRPDDFWALRITPPDEPQLGLATTAQLLSELTARAEVGGYANYRTVDA
jgi:hypothetical protein